MTLRFTLLASRFAIVRLSPDASLPKWAMSVGDFLSVTRTADELSIIAAEALLPPDVRASRGWRCLALIGPFALNAVGIAAEFTAVLAKANVSVLVISTHDTDYLLIRDEAINEAIAALEDAGHEITIR